MKFNPVRRKTMNLPRRGNLQMNNIRNKLKCKLIPYINKF